MTNYMPLPYSYSNAEYSSQPNDPSSNNKNSSQPVLPVSPPLQQGIMSISQPETPRPESAQNTPPPSSSNEKLNISPNLVRRRPPIPSRPANFTTTTFHSNPYPSAGPIRRRRTESIFSFEMGPTFTSTKQIHELCNMDQSNSYQVQLHAKMDRGFFRADQDWTCYRRNYFQVSSTFDIHGMNYLIQGPEVPCLLRKSDTQECLQVDYFSIGVRARVTNHDKKIELVQHTPKRDKGPQIIPEPRPVRAGGNLHLASVGSNHNIVTFERLQFKTATANNGKRRAAQQYYEIVVDLYANLSRGDSICVATCTSAALVVRGRSPGHYADSHTRFKHMDADSSISNNEPSTSSTSATDERFSNGSTNHPVTANAGIDQQQQSPNRRYTSLPTSPISDFGPYSPYGAYPYPSLSNYPPIMTSSHPPPPISGLSQYASHPAPSHNGPYFQNDQTHPPPPPPPIFENDHHAAYATHGGDSKNLKSEAKSHGYWTPNEIPRIGHHQENNSSPQQQYNNGHMYSMNSSGPYGRPPPPPHHENNGPYSSSGLDAGRSQ